MDTTGSPFNPQASSLNGAVHPDVLAELFQVRSSIDNIDAALIHLLAERFKATQRVGVLKATHSLPPADPGREEEQIQRLRALARSADLDPVFAEKFLTFIISEVIRHHQAIAETMEREESAGRETEARDDERRDDERMNGGPQGG